MRVLVMKKLFFQKGFLLSLLILFGTQGCYFLYRIRDKIIIDDYERNRMAKETDWQCGKIGWIGFRNYTEYENQDSIPKFYMARNPEDNQYISLVSSLEKENVIESLSAQWSNIKWLRGTHHLQVVLSTNRFLWRIPNISMIEDLPILRKNDSIDQIKIQKIIDNYVEAVGYSGIYDMGQVFERKHSENAIQDGKLIVKERNVDYYAIGYLTPGDSPPYWAAKIFSAQSNFDTLVTGFELTALILNPTNWPYLLTLGTIPDYTPGLNARVKITIYNKNWDAIESYDYKWNYSLSSSWLYKDSPNLLDGKRYRTSTAYNPQPLAENAASEIRKEILEYQSNHCNGKEW